MTNHLKIKFALALILLGSVYCLAQENPGISDDPQPEAIRNAGQTPPQFNSVPSTIGTSQQPVPDRRQQHQIDVTWRIRPDPKESRLQRKQ